MFWFMLIAVVAVVAAVALAVLGDGGALRDAEPDRLEDRLPDDRPVGRADIDELRLPVAVRGYRMVDVDDVLDRLGAELSERDARIAELEAERAGERAAALTKTPFQEPHQAPFQEPHRAPFQEPHREPRQETDQRPRHHAYPQTRPEDQPHEG